MTACLLRLCLVVAVLPAAATHVIPHNSTLLRFFGRHVINKDASRFDWVGTGVSLRLKKSTSTSINAISTANDSQVSVEMDAGGRTRFAVFMQPNESAPLVRVNDFFTNDGDGSRTYPLYRAELGEGDIIISLVKASEDRRNVKAVAFFSISLGPGLQPTPLEPSTSRRMDVYGDSDSAAFGIDANGNSDDCKHHSFDQEDFAHGWVINVAKLLGMALDGLHAQAVSGIGVVKNAEAIIPQGACSTTTPLPKLVGRTLQSEKESFFPYNASSSGFKPDVVVIYVGSNDYVNLLPPSEKQFKEHYDAFVRDILRPWKPLSTLFADSKGEPFVETIAGDGEGNGSVPPVVHVCGPEQKPCEYIQAVAQQHAQEGKWTSIYTTTGDKGVAKGGCGGHRNITQQVALAKHLAPIIASAARW